jgi:tetratricopeptide (TPR) repeat protein
LAGKANAHTRGGAWEKARAVLEPLVSKGAEDAGMATVYARIAVHDGDYDRAVEVASRHLQDRVAQEIHRTLLFDIGAAHERAGRYDDAFESFSQANRVTTGSWDPAASTERLDEIMTVFGRESLESLPPATTPARQSEVPVFIVGMMRSGSTLVEQIIDTHPEAHGAGEIAALPDLVREMSLRVGSTLPYPQCVRELDADDFEALAASYLTELQRVAPTARRVCDKHLINYEHLGLIQALFPKARVIHTRRDAMDTCLSCFCSRFPPGVPAFTEDLEHLGMRFNDYLAIMEHWRSTLDMALLEIDYETLVEDQEGTTRRILEFLGLPWDESCLRFHESPRQALTLSREQVSRPIYRSAVDRHRHYDRHLGPLRAVLESGRRGCA